MTDERMQPHFCLWREPWIQLQRPDGAVDTLSLRETLVRAQNYESIIELSPLAVVGIHRLLVAILQDALEPRRIRDLQSLRRQAAFAPDAIQAFEQAFGARFDLFSEDAPFLQCAELTLEPTARDKSVTYLHPSWPFGEVTHFRHGVSDEMAFCPACAASGLVSMPSCALAIGRSFRFPMAGRTPVFVLPQGSTLHESLAASLAIPKYQPDACDAEDDRAWWRRKAVIGNREEVHRVGYVHSLTFPIRRVRLHPEAMELPCSRCGRQAPWGVRAMVFDAGEYFADESSTWEDPFVAYRLPSARRQGAPRPVMVTEGRALWRDYSALFLTTPEQHEDPRRERTRRPLIIDQMAEVAESDPGLHTSFRCIGIRTETMRVANIHEWIDDLLDVPGELLDEGRASVEIEDGLAFAERVMDHLRGIWARAFKEPGLSQRMEAAYWEALSGPFRSFVLDMVDESQITKGWRAWVSTVIDVAEREFVRASEQTGTDAEALRRQVQAQAQCRQWLLEQRKEVWGDE